MIDTDPDEGIASRKRVLEAAAEHNHLVLSAHFPAPSVGRIKSDGAAYRWEYERLEGA